jgi:hypothetical protein
MRTITLDVSDELADQLAAVQDRLPELLALSLQQPAVPASIYRALLTFLANGPTREQILAFGPTPEMQQRLDLLLERSRAKSLTPVEEEELRELEHIEHLVVLLKTRSLPARSAMS